MFDKELAIKVEKVIKDKFPLIYEYNFDGIVLLYGGTIKNVIMKSIVHDLDFAILTQEKCQIIDFINKFKLKYYKNAGGGYKILYDNFTIDIASYKDLMDTGIYDIDMLFFDINKRNFISFGAINAIDSRTIREINNEKNPLYSNKARLKKLIKFIKYISRNNKRVKIKQNKISWELKMLKRRIKVLFDKTLNGNFRKCFSFLNNCKKEFNLIIILGLFNVLISTIYPALSGRIITNILSENYKTLALMIILIVILKLISIVSSYLFSKLYYFVRKKMIFNMRKSIINSVLSFEIDNFNDNNRGTFIDKLNNDPNEIVRIFNGVKDLLIKGLGNIGVLIYIFCLNYYIGILLFIFMVIIFNIRITGIRKKNIYRRKYFNEQEKYNGVLGEMINGISDIKNLDLKNNYVKLTESSFVSIGNNEYKGDNCYNFYNNIAYLIQFVALGTILLLGLFLVKNNILSTSSLVIIFMYYPSVFTFLERLGKLANLFADLDISCNRIFSLIDGNLYIKEVFGNKYKNKCNGKIEFDLVNFRYGYKNQYVLNNCSFTINHNETIAIVGRSGSGKTTILNLIARLYNVDSGIVKIDEININEYSENYIRENISVISQSPYLFDMSIKDNFRLVKEDISDKEIKKVCKLVYLDKFIESLPNKYDTIIGEGGVKLSGGQKQRLGIARALIKDTKIILLDEITSALDNETSSVVKKVIKNISKNHTIIIVTHELSIIEDNTRVLLLDKGKIVSDGVHSDLLTSNSDYKKLYKIK